MRLLLAEGWPNSSWVLIQLRAILLEHVCPIWRLYILDLKS